MRSIVIALLASCAAPQAHHLEWRLTQPPARDRVDVTLAVDSRAIALPPLQAVNEATEAPARCSVTADSELHCCTTPYYNYYRASLQSGALVVTRVSGTDSDPNELRAVIARVPLAGTFAVSIVHGDIALIRPTDDC
jgi:hypothetical protein